MRMAQAVYEHRAALEATQARLVKCEYDQAQERQRRENSLVLRAQQRHDERNALEAKHQELLGAESRAVELRVKQAMEARLREIVSHLAQESEGHQQQVQVQCAQKIEKAEVKMREFEQNSEAAVVRIRLDAKTSVEVDVPRLAQAEDALRVQARQFRYEREEMT